MEQVNAPHAAQRAIFTGADEPVLTDWMTANPEMIKKAKSIARHQLRAALQQE